MQRSRRTATDRITRSRRGSLSTKRGGGRGVGGGGGVWGAGGGGGGGGTAPPGRPRDVARVIPSIYAVPGRHHGRGRAAPHRPLRLAGERAGLPRGGPHA